jgi:regulator of sigma E protease
MPFVYFIVLVGVLVLVHELGHFACAKYFGVRVLTFSLGFGPRIAGFRRGDTDYVLSALPLGGYVRLLGDNPRDEIRAAQRRSSFAHQHVLRRTLIVVAGPAMNLVFPVLLYFVVFLGDSELRPPTVGIVFPDRPAYGKLFAGDVIRSVDFETTETFYEVSRIVEHNANRPLRFEAERDGKTITEIIVPELASAEGPLELTREVGRIGILGNHPLPVLGVASPATPAGAARLRTFDRVVAIGGEPVERWIDLERRLSRNRGSMVPVTYLRPVPLDRALGGLVELSVYEPRVATLTPEASGGSLVERTGIESADLYVSEVTAGSPEHALGLLPGDRLLQLDGRPIRQWATFLEDLKTGRGKSHALSWRRGEQRLQGSFALEHEGGVTEHGQVYDRYVVGIRNWVPTRSDPPVPNPSPILYAAREAVRATTDVVELTVLSVVRLLQGRITVKSIGGPLTIFQVAGTAAREGALNYLTLMAFISINLGLINLLPIPMLDGGHLFFFLAESVVRRPLSARMRERAHILGLIILIAMMVLAFVNDVERQWPALLEYLASE